MDPSVGYSFFKKVSFHFQIVQGNSADSHPSRKFLIGSLPVRLSNYLQR